MKDLIIYINQNSQFDIYAVQLEYYKFEEYEILIPKLFGVEVKKNIKKYTKVKQWDRKSWFAKLEETQDIDGVNTVKKFEESVSDKPFHFHYSSQRMDDKATLWICSDPKDYYSKIFGFIVNGNVELPFGALKGNPPFNDEYMRQKLIQRLNKIPGVNIKTKSLTGRPTFPLSKIRNEKALTKFCNVIDWCIQEISKYQDK